ncbi:hypothetical protein BDZ97DRAFT_1827148, partial [Flammula alnicola]
MNPQSFINGQWLLQFLESTMKLNIVGSLAFGLGLFSHAFALPTPQVTTAVIHCDIPGSLTCPVGYRCCGSISADFGG